MAAAQLTQIKIVNPALIQRWLAMVERAGGMTRGEIIGATVASVGPLTVFLMWLTGILATNASTAHDLVAFREQLEGVKIQMSRLSEKIDGGPRLDQMREFDRRLSAHEGRMDALERQLILTNERLIKMETILGSLSVESPAIILRRRQSKNGRDE